MKHFVYLDDQKMKSFYAQAFDGLDTLYETNQMHARNDNVTLEPAVTQKNKEGTLGVGSTGLTGGENITRPRKVREYGDTETVQNSVTQLLHDNAVNRIISYAEEKEYLSRAPIVGKYLSVTGPYQIIDWDYYLRMIKGEFRTFTIDWKTSTVEIPPNANDATIKHLRGAVKKEYTEGLDRYVQMLRLLKEMLPFDLLLIMGDYIIPMKRNSFLEDAGQMLIMYQEEITIFGRVTKISSEIVDHQGTLGLGELTSMVNEFTKSILSQFVVNIERAIFVSPMAAFFETQT